MEIKKWIKTIIHITNVGLLGNHLSVQSVVAKYTITPLQKNTNVQDVNGLP